jgi:L-threonylcarbamoyladenylate synthase
MTPIIHIHDQASLADGIAQAAQVLESGGIVLYPTDTTYALAANALDVNAVDRIFQVKGRDYSKPIHVVVRDMEQAAQYVEVNQNARRIAAQFLPGGLTIVLPLKPNSAIPSLLVAGAGTLGIRIPKQPVSEALSRAIDFPTTTTSANRSGMPNTYTIEAVAQQLGTDFNQIDLALDAGQIDGDGVSTVIAIAGDAVTLIREGVIPFMTITDFHNTIDGKA